MRSIFQRRARFREPHAVFAQEALKVPPLHAGKAGRSRYIPLRGRHYLDQVVALKLLDHRFFGFSKCTGR